MVSVERKRFDEIDILRAFGILGVIAIHIFTYSLTSPLNRFLWNYLQFVVISFVFCSGFVLAAIYKNRLNSLAETIRWYRKRIIRLLVPFYIYLIAHYSLWLVFPNFFQGLGLKKSPEYFVQSVLLFGGTNFNWLPLLFLQLSLLFPLLLIVIKNKSASIAYVLFALLVTFYFTFFHFPYSDYRLVMWIPWSLMLFFAIFLFRKGVSDRIASITNIRYLTIGIIFFAWYLLFYIFNSLTGKSLIFYSHKYPPDFYYLFFGTALTLFALIIAKARIFQLGSIKKVYSFISRNSYQLFFVHYIVLDSVLTLRNRISLLINPYVDFVIIFSVSILICLLIQRIVSFFEKLKPIKFSA